MNAIVFSGPSMPREEVDALASVEWRPPVSQGDVFRAAQSAPDVIGIIDGYFDGEPSVWHKEILWAMSRGIYVFGAASMGALRAAELHPFGMRGVGTIFERYRDGTYEDDDEVAVLHGPAELGYVPMSVPMVNARATIEKAVGHSIVTESEGAVLTAAAKSVFYQKRHWDEVLAAAEIVGIDPRALATFQNWLPGGMVDLKQEDARRMLDELAAFIDAGNEPMHCNFSFEWTVMWDDVVAGLTGASAQNDIDGSNDVDALVLDELRQTPDKYQQFSLRTRTKQLALREAGRARIEPETAQTREQLTNLRQSLGLYTREQFEAWVRHNDWSPKRLQVALENEQRCRIVTDELIDAGNQTLIEELRLSGDYPSLKERALAKQASRHSTPAELDIAPASLLAWYFESNLGKPIPENLDDYLSGIGIHRREDFYRMAKREYLFSLAMAEERP